MARVVVPVGRLSEHPYRIEKIERNIYSIEELCYSLVQSAQFLDTSIMDPELVSWISEELGLRDLAAKLYPYLGKERSLSDFVSTILNYVGYISQDRQLRTKQIVQSGQGMEPFERRLKKAKYLAENGQSYEAIDEYKALIADLPEPEREMRCLCHARIGRIYSSLFRFRAASESLLAAYSISGNAEDYLQYLAAVRFMLSDEEYVSFIAEHPESYSVSLELERRLREINAEYSRSPEKEQVDMLENYRANGQEMNYEVLLHRIVQNLKDQYRITRKTMADQN